MVQDPASGGKSSADEPSAALKPRSTFIRPPLCSRPVKPTVGRVTAICLFKLNRGGLLQRQLYVF